jgi:hypothetical protein
MATEASEQGTDGDELMVKDGKTFSKFSKNALEIGEDVGAFILGKVRKIFDLNKGDDAVFRTRNGAPKIMTKFKDISLTRTSFSLNMPMAPRSFLQSSR